MATTRSVGSLELDRDLGTGPSPSGIGANLMFHATGATGLPLASLEIRNAASDSTLNAARAAYAHPSMHETPESKAVA